jgi:thiamine-phosphate pyrophosphorylase
VFPRGNLSSLNNPAARPILCYVTDRKSLDRKISSKENFGIANLSDDLRDLLSHIRSARAAGMDWIQLREKDLSGRNYSSLARAAIERISSSQSVSSSGPSGQVRNSSRILINDRLDVAIAEQADGIHLGGNSLPIKEVRRWLLRQFGQTEQSDKLAEGIKKLEAEKFLAGVSCHSLESAQHAAADGADYIFLGPIFATPSKAAYGAPQGLDRLKRVCDSLSIPVLAIGGITRENAASCITAGAAGIAAIGLFQQSGNLADLVSELRAILTK